MVPLCRKLSQFVLPLFALFTLAIPSQATTVVMLSDEELIVSSRFVITGKVRSVISAWDDSHTMVWTYVEVRADRVLKGELNTRTIVLREAGGVVGSSGFHIFGQPRFSKGQRVLLYLNSSPDGTLHVAHTFMGKFTVTEDKKSGKKFVTRAIEAGEVEIISHHDDEAITDRAPLEQYVGKIEEVIERKADEISRIEAERDPLPVQFIPVEYAQKKAESGELSPNYVLIGGGVRWMQADSGQPVIYNVNANRSPVSGGGTTELTRAMDAWSAQSGANIRLQVGSQTSSCGLQSDGANTISFADCLSQLDQPVGCSGVVALTRIQWINESRVINGRSFNRLTESDIIFNKGMDCFLGNSANLAEVACHELGHSIGLDHSSDIGAIMWASAHGQGRNATLGADDRSGVLVIYPAGSGGGGGGGTGGGGGGTGGGGNGGGSGGPVTITSLTLGEGQVGRTYKQQLTATGGSPPYRWSLVGGSLPPGLSFSSGGVIEGRPTRAGLYSLGVQVVDSTGGFSAQDGKRVSLNILNEGESPTIFPLITRIKVKGSKKLYVYGNNFNSESFILLNGILLTPKEFDIEDGTGKLFYKGRLDLGPSGTNAVIVINSNNRSTPFLF